MEISSGDLIAPVTTGPTVAVTQAYLGEQGGTTPLVTLTNSAGMEVRFLGRGGIILSISTPDRNGTLGDVVLGFECLEHYVNDTFYFGALIGRNANRIADAEFTLEGQRHTLSRNDGRNHLHGGVHGFSACEWHVETFERDNEVAAELTLVSAAGDQGYPGEVRACVTYRLNNANEFAVEYEANVNAPTPVNLTQHSYFNLSGGGQRDILQHELTVLAAIFTPVDARLIPTGEFRSVANTPFDFRTSQGIGARMSTDDEQLKIGGGYDHNFVLDVESGVRCRPVARLFDPHSGRLMEVSTTEPGMQVFTGNELEEVRGGKSGAYVRHGGIALETQHFPDTPNHDNFPTTVLRPGASYRSTTVYRFSVSETGY